MVEKDEEEMLLRLNEMAPLLHFGPSHFLSLGFSRVVDPPKLTVHTFLVLVTNDLLLCSFLCITSAIGSISSTKQDVDVYVLYLV